MKQIMTSMLVLIFATSVFAQERYSPSECPVVGNKNSGIYHVPGQQDYAKMLVKNKTGSDNRVCFNSTQEAQKSRYRASKKKVRYS